MFYMPQRQIDILAIFAEAQHAWEHWGRSRTPNDRGDCVARKSAAVPVALAATEFETARLGEGAREAEIDRYVARRRIRALGEYKRRLLAGERPRGLNLKLWKQAARAIGIELSSTQPAAGPVGPSRAP